MGEYQETSDIEDLLDGEDSDDDNERPPPNLLGYVLTIFSDYYC